ncbi:hypothetical protein M514_03008 [Trichuris suis]|uniref:Uncharacterized protein n=1 Tax=Trichuris suis TaxID=68888 RepID=A0A085NI14_9BILA|nr:hypothetical protein M514_03008 [Trichuris suis]
MQISLPGKQQHARADGFQHILRSQDVPIVEAKAYSSADGSAVTVGKNSVNGPASGVCRGMHKWTAPKLLRNDSCSSWIHKSNSLKDLFSNDRGRNSVCSISRYIELTRKHFQFLEDPHDDRIFFDEVKSTVKEMPKKKAPELSSVYPCLSKPCCGIDCPCWCLQSQHLSANRSMLPGYESTALLCTNPSTVCNEYSDMPSTSCQRATEAIPTAGVCSSDKQECIVSTNQGNENVSGEGRPVSIFLDDVVFGQQKLA